MPKSIKYFERCFLGALVLGIINAILTAKPLLDLVAANPELFSDNPELDAANYTFLVLSGLLGNLLLKFLIVGFLILFTSRQGNNVTKWILVLLFVFMIFKTAFYSFFAIIAINIPEAFENVEVAFFQISLQFMTLLLIAFLLNCVGIYFLFTKDSRAWFEKTTANNNME